MGTAYDHANSVVRRETHLPLLTGVASTKFYRWAAHQKARIRKVRWLVDVAGTNDNAGIDFLNGTTSVGDLTIGTNAAGSALVSSDLSTTVDAGGFLEFKGKATSATMAGYVTIEWEVLPDATQS